PKCSNGAGHFVDFLLATNIFAYGASLCIVSWVVQGSAGVLGDAADRRVEFPLVYYLAIFRYLLLGYWALGGCCSWVYLVLES
uniref:hypothetical protein n=1 Tax=uncultured Senegalimassilia sp. TaxID=1714350 RepID=UPI0026DFB53B